MRPTTGPYSVVKPPTTCNRSAAAWGNSVFKLCAACMGVALCDLLNTTYANLRSDGRMFEQAFLFRRDVYTPNVAYRLRHTHVTRKQILSDLRSARHHRYGKTIGNHIKLQPATHTQLHMLP